MEKQEEEAKRNTLLLSIWQRLRRQEREHEESELARLALKAHFAEDRNEFLTDDDIRSIGKR